jgi:hypothetical protein
LRKEAEVAKMDESGTKNMGLMQVKEHLRAEFGINQRILEDRIDKIENTIDVFSALDVLAANDKAEGNNLLDKIAHYVINEGLAEKVKEL